MFRPCNIFARAVFPFYPYSRHPPRFGGGCFLSKNGEYKSLPSGRFGGGFFPNGSGIAFGEKLYKIIFKIKQVDIIFCLILKQILFNFCPEGAS